MVVGVAWLTRTRLVPLVERVGAQHMGGAADTRVDRLACGGIESRVDHALDGTI